MTPNPMPNVSVLLIAEVLEAVAEALRRGHVDPTAVAVQADVPTLGGSKLLVSVADAAEMLSVSRTTAYELIAKGAIPSVKIGRRRLVPTEELRLRIAGWRLPVIDE